MITTNDNTTISIANGSVITYDTIIPIEFQSIVITIWKIVANNSDEIIIRISINGFIIIMERLISVKIPIVRKLVSILAGR